MEDLDEIDLEDFDSNFKQHDEGTAKPKDRNSFTDKAEEEEEDDEVNVEEDEGAAAKATPQS